MFEAIRRDRSKTSLAVACVLMITAATGTALAGPWAGQEVSENGVLHVKNPATPQEKPVKVELEELWRIGGEDDEEIFGVIIDIIHDDEGNYYMLDAQLNEIKVYSSDGEWLRNIGREGEGPGEFRGPSNLFRIPGGNIGVLQTFPGKVVTLTPDGDPAQEYPLPEIEGGGFRVLMSADYAGDNLALIYALNQPSETGFTQSNVFSLIEPSGKVEHRLHSQDSSMQAASPVIAEKEWDSFRNGRWAAAPDGRAFACPEFSEYKINVWNADGKLDRVIVREYPEHKRSAEDKERLLEIYKGFTRRIPIPNIKYEIEDTFNEIGQLYARNDGSLWVLTSRGSNDLADGVIGTFDVFDKKGRFVNQVTLKGEGDPQNDGYFFVGDRLFVVTDFLAALMALQGGGGGETDDEDEPGLMQVISYKLDVPGIGG